MNDEIQLLIIKRKATERRYVSSQNPSLLSELITISDEIEAVSELARSTFYQEKIANTLNSYQDVWREL